MKILTAAAFHAWDEYTIAHEPVSSLALMDRAAGKCTQWLTENFKPGEQFAIFCGKGNNGGDGLAIAGLLIENGYPVSVYILEFGFTGTPDFQANLARIHTLTDDIHFIQDASFFHALSRGMVIIDAMYGTGLNREPGGLLASLIIHINSLNAIVVSIDIPSGMPADSFADHGNIIKASFTLSFQGPKFAFMLPENEDYLGRLIYLDISLHPGFLDEVECEDETIDIQLVKSIYRPRKRSSHKGTFGHALIVAGSAGKMGAAILSSGACLRSGAGLVTALVPPAGNDIMQVAVPEAMTLVEPPADLQKYQAIGIGPGIGMNEDMVALTKFILNKAGKPVLIDADVLNIIASGKELIALIPQGSVLTPHPKEFDRLFGMHDNHYLRIKKAREQAAALNVVIILKGHHTFIATPGGKGYFNCNGNPGMATAGSGDVLSGIITGLLAQGYDSVEAAIFGVWLHGYAGDLAAEYFSEEALIAGDITASIRHAFLYLGKI